MHEWRIGEDRVKSKIEIDPATQMDAGVYECTADNMYSIDRRSFKTDFSIAFDWFISTWNQTDLCGASKYNNNNKDDSDHVPYSTYFDKIKVSNFWAFF